MTPRFLSILVLSFVFGVAAPLVPSRAGSVNSCIDKCFGGVGDQPGYTDLRDICVKKCSQSTISYGAIAYGAQSTANGYAFGKGNAGDADRTAMANCQRHGNDCKIVASFSNSCVVVAAVESEGRFATGQAGTRDQAQANAMKACQANGSGKCEIETWTCAFP